KDGTGTGNSQDGHTPPGGGNPPPPPPTTNSSNSPRQLVSPELISFKAIVSGDTLAVRGYLRRDYRSTPVGGDQQIAYPFGEFRFSGCRKIVTTVPDSQIAGRSFALAPKGTKFDHMWFSGISSGLTLFDGTFPAFPPFILPTPLNEYASIAGDPTSTLA